MTLFFRLNLDPPSVMYHNHSFTHLNPKYLIYLSPLFFSFLHLILLAHFFFSSSTLFSIHNPFLFPPIFSYFTSPFVPSLSFIFHFLSHPQYHQCWKHQLAATDDEKLPTVAMSMPLANHNTRNFQ